MKLPYIFTDDIVENNPYEINALVATKPLVFTCNELNDVVTMSAMRI